VIAIFNFSEFFSRIFAAFVIKKNIYPRMFMVPFNFGRSILLVTSLLLALSSAEIFKNQALIIINLILVPATNGIMAVSASATLSNRLEKHEKELGGFIIAICMNGGISLGSFISLIGLSHLF
jgi:hypothetical protein